MNLKEQLDTLLDATAFDSTGTKIGAVRQVYVDDASGKLTFATVSTGIFSADAIVPLHGARLLDDELHVDHTRAVIRDSPRPDNTEDALTPAQEVTLLEHYGLEAPARDRGAAEPEPRSGAKPGPAAKPKSESKPGPAPEPKSGAKPEPAPKPKSESTSGATSAPESKPASGPKSPTEPKPKSGSPAEPKPTPEPAPGPGVAGTTSASTGSATSASGSATKAKGTTDKETRPGDGKAAGEGGTKDTGETAAEADTPAPDASRKSAARKPAAPTTARGGASDGKVTDGRRADGKETDGRRAGGKETDGEKSDEDTTTTTSSASPDTPPDGADRAGSDRPGSAGSDGAATSENGGDSPSRRRD